MTGTIRMAGPRPGISAAATRRGLSAVVATAVAASIAASIASVVMASPVHAEPVDEPCALAVSLLCRFVPIAPSLDGDVDYTQQQPGAGILAPESAQPVDPCISGCI
ncbi:fibronectin-binding protein [Mycolicibacterium sp. A43C]